MTDTPPTTIITAAELMPAVQSVLSGQEAPKDTGAHALEAAKALRIIFPEMELRERSEHPEKQEYLIEIANSFLNLSQNRKTNWLADMVKMNKGENGVPSPAPSSNFDELSVKKSTKIRG